jgi:hypothetical protein
MGAIGISPYDVESGWRRNINIAIREGNSRTVVMSIAPTYEAKLEEYLAN